MSEQDDFGGYGIAIVGMAARVPGASNPDEYWNNLRNGKESVQFYTDEELLARGVRPEQLKNPHYVKAGAPLDKMEYFDPDFFGFSPKEAAILDPQHRQFYECCWEALERAGHAPSRFDGAIGVFAGCGMGAYFAQNLITNPELVESVGMFLLRHTGNDKDFLATRVSYSLNLTGPSINVQTACSTSSVATHLACQSLLSEECDMAIAGGVTIEIPHGLGYPYREGEILSPDGHCRPFDHRSKGTIFGSGTGAIVLRRLADAIADGDHIHGVIIGSAVNNDGSNKVGYLAPSVEGQAHAITEALEIADVDADSIGYVECHGTGTPVGDPIEISALTAAFSQTSERTGYCGVGSVKSNIGHLDTAAGVIGIIKATLAVEKGEIPPSLNYEAPNPSIDFVRSPFYVNDKLKKWDAQDGNPDNKKQPRRAAINSLGVGGTNAFIIVEEPPTPKPSSPHARSNHLITLSAKSRKSLDAYCIRLAQHLKDHPQLDLADVAYTLYNGRETFEHRRVLSCVDHDEAIQLLESKDQRRVFTHSADNEEKSMVFMFPGGGAQYADMSKGLYDAEPVFKDLMDQGFAVLKEKTGQDYKHFLFVDEQDLESVDKELKKPSVQLPLIFLVEYALAKLWMSLGIKPDALIGHSMGENTAACLAGVFEFNDALGLVLLRGQLMDDVPKGGMLSVQLPAEQLKEHLHDKLALAAINSPMLSVASGTKADLNALSEKLTSLDIENKTIPIDIAAHSWLLDGMLTPFGDYLRSIKLNKPELAFISNYTGTWITDQQATDPEYWVKHLRNTVRFSDGINTLLAKECIFLEVGPGNTLGSLTRQNPEAPTQRVFSTLRHPQEKMPDLSYFLTVLGRLWAVGYNIESVNIWPEEKRYKVPLPSYAFQHNPYWIEPGKPAQTDVNEFSALEKLEVWEEWFRKPVWVQQGVLPKPSKPKTWLVFDDGNGVGEKLIEKLRNQGNTVVSVVGGDAYYKISNEEYCIASELGAESYSTLVKDLVASGNFPDSVLHLWLLTSEESFRPGSSFLHRNQEKGFYSLFFFARAMADEDLIERELDLLVYTNGSQQVSGEAVPYPEKATVLGPCKVLPREFPGIHCRYIDIDIAHTEQESGFSVAKLTKRNNDGEENKDVSPAIIELMHKELYAIVEDGVYAYRNDVRWQLQYDHAASEVNTDKSLNRLRQDGVYFITGGLGGIAYVVATDLAKQYQAKLVLVNRTPLPAKNEWSDWLRTHGMEDAISRNIIKVKELEAAGADVLVLSGDVTDIDRMREVVQEAENHFGKINGVIHAAGTVDDGLIQMKSQADMENVFAPKIYGTLVLDELFSGKDLDVFVLFSSTSTIIAPVGQIDYVAANAFMNAYAHRRNSQEKGYTCAVNWGVWNEVGMAAATAYAQGYGKAAKQEKVVSANYPLFDKQITQSTGGKDTFLFTAYLSCHSHWVLDEHRSLNEQALLPGSAYIELARAAIHESGEKGAFELKELIFLKALYVPDNETVTARVKLQQTTAGYQFSIQSETLDVKGNKGWQTHAEARVLLGSKDSSTETLDSVLARFSLPKTDVKSPAIKTRQEDHLHFGPRWAVLRDAKYGNQEAVARLSLADEFTDDQTDYEIHPALLDIATGYAMDLIKGYSNDDDLAVNLWVPVSYGSFVFYKPLTQQVYSWVSNHTDNSIDKDFASFDVVMYDSRGQVLAEVKELTLKKLTGIVDFSNDAVPASVEQDIQQNSVSSSGEFRQLSPAEMAFQHNLSQGILPSEGSKALFSVLNNSTATEVIISSLELEGLIKEVDATAASLHKEENDTKFARPDLDNDYIGPRDDIDKTLVGFWEELLGVDQVGIEDSFFDLGGHSLIAVRLFAKIQQVYNADYPISILFEAPTISACSDLIREAVGGSVSSEASSNDSSEKTHKARYTYLVPMHSAKLSDVTPFFLVAGMFGNVLNLRHLAQLIGTDRPFYGLQARGLYGDSTPHETFEEMAKDYIAELLTVQSSGPFILGGFSGGGITAFEMAKQLTAMGHEVAEIILLDTPLPFHEPLSSVDRMSIHWQRIKSKGAGYFSEWANNRYQWELQKFRKRFNKADEGKEDHDFQSERMEMAFYDALGRYDINPLDIRATLFRPRLDIHYRLAGGRVANSVRELIYKDNGWPPYVANLDVYEVPGNHDSMVLEPNVRVLASKLRQAIENADPKTRKR